MAKSDNTGILIAVAMLLTALVVVITLRLIIG